MAQVRGFVQLAWTGPGTHDRFQCLEVNISVVEPHSGVLIRITEEPEEILVHRSPKRSRMSLFSLNPTISEVIIRKNAESDSEMRDIL